MKDIVIKAKHIKRELIVAAVCVVLVSCWNAYAIWKYGTQWRELYSVWYAVLFMSVLLYIVLIPFRYLGCKLGKLIKKRCCKKDKCCTSDTITPPQA